MAKIGRNDPCPCDSGRKYKKCCLFASERERELWERFILLAQEDAAAGDLVAAATAAVAGVRRLDVRRARLLAGTLAGPLRGAKRIADFDALLGELRSRHPQALEPCAAWFHSFCAENAALDARADIETPLAALATEFPDHLPDFLRLVDMILYHGHHACAYPLLRQTLREADAALATDDVEHRMLLAMQHMVGTLQLLDPACDVESAAARLSEDLPADKRPGLARFEMLLRHARGEAAGSWRQVDFLDASEDELLDRLQVLTMDFAHVLHAEKAWPRARALLASDETGRHLLSARALWQSPDPAAAAEPFVFVDPLAAALHLMALLRSSPPCTHRAAAFVTALPAWIDFCEHNGLVDRESAPQLRRDLRKLIAELPSSLERLSAFDPRLAVDVRKSLRGLKRRRAATDRPRRADQLALFAPQPEARPNATAPHDHS